MFDHNPFRDTKNYWKSYYTTITEGWNDEVEDVTGFKWIEKDHEQYDPKHDPQGHGHHFYNEETGEKMSQDEVMKLYDSKKNKNTEDLVAGPNPSDWDARKQGEESTHSEEVEYDGEELDEASNLRRHMSRIPHREASLIRRAGGSTEQIRQGITGKRTPAAKSGRALLTQAYKDAENKDTRQEGLFHKDSDRLLREHIRAEYEARGIYPTSREVQETFNTVMDLIEKRKSYEQSTASLMLRGGASGEEVKHTVGRKRTPEGKSGNAILRKARKDAELKGIMQHHFTDDKDEPIDPRIKDHLARRVTRPNPRTEKEVGLNIKGADGLSKGISIGLGTLSPEERENAIRNMSSENPEIRKSAKQIIFQKGKKTLPTASSAKGPSPSSPARKQSQVEIDTRRGKGEGESPAYQRLIMFNTGR